MRRLAIYIYTPLAVAYIALSYIYPLDHATLGRRQLDLIVARIVSVSVAILFVAVWYLALYASAQLRSYSIKIRLYRDGPAFVDIANGVQLLAFYLPARNVTKIVLNYEVFLHPSFTSLANVFITYASLAIPLVAFILIGRGAQRFESVAKTRVSLPELYALGMSFILLTVWYCYASFTHANNTLSANWLVTIPSALPPLLRTVTIIMPYIFMWFVGLIAVYGIILYQRYVQGIIYRQALKFLSLGLALLIIISIIIQFVTASIGELQASAFAIVLAITYGLIIFLGLAFGLIARGVRNLWLLDHI